MFVCLVALCTLRREKEEEEEEEEEEEGLFKANAVNEEEESLFKAGGDPSPM